MYICVCECVHGFISLKIMFFYFLTMYKGDAFKSAHFCFHLLSNRLVKLLALLFLQCLLVLLVVIVVVSSPHQSPRSSTTTTTTCLIGKSIVRLIYLKLYSDYTLISKINLNVLCLTFFASLSTYVHISSCFVYIYIYIYIYKTSGYCIGTRKAWDLGSTPSECQIFYLFRCVLSSMLPLRSVGRSNLDKGRHNLTTLIQETDIY